jgi:hypothetical protein
MLATSTITCTAFPSDRERRLQEPGFKLRRDLERLALLIAHAAEHFIRKLAGVGSDARSNLLPQEVLNVFGQVGWRILSIAIRDRQWYPKGSCKPVCRPTYASGCFRSAPTKAVRATATQAAGSAGAGSRLKPVARQAPNPQSPL